MLLQSNKRMGYGYAPLIIALFFICLSNVALAADGVKKVTGSLKLSAMVDNQPAFSSVRWTINLKKLTENKLVRVVSKHAATVELEPGNYQIILSVNSQEEVRNITIVEKQQSSLVINLHRDD
ncbi:MAG: hypothetical protein R3F02_19320 [Thiolinea sp.]